MARAYVCSTLAGTGAALLLAMAAACSDSSKTDQPAAGAGQSGESATSMGGEGGAPLGAGGSAPSCDCGNNPDFVHVPLDCACKAGLCTTFAEDLMRFGTPAMLLGLPFYVRLGICASGYRTLSYEEACENRGSRTYDVSGNLVYSSYGPYGSAPPVCGQSSDFADFGIGETDPARDCTYCIVSRDDGEGGEGGHSAAVAECYPRLATYMQCEPDALR